MQRSISAQEETTLHVLCASMSGLTAYVSAMSRSSRRDAAYSNVAAEIGVLNLLASRAERDSDLLYTRTLLFPFAKPERQADPGSCTSIVHVKPALNGRHRRETLLADGAIGGLHVASAELEVHPAL